MIVKRVKQVMNIPSFFHFHAYSREIFDMFPYLKGEDNCGALFCLGCLVINDCVVSVGEGR